MALRGRRPNTEEQFWEHVAKKGPNECWNWTRKPNNAGYGQMSLQKTIYPAHRLAWSITHGSVPADKVVSHTCHNKLCCNPKHLFLSTQLEASQDMVALKRKALGMKLWHQQNPVTQEYRDKKSALLTEIWANWKAAGFTGRLTK